VPNLIGALAEAPEAAEAYLALTQAMYNSAFTAEERNVVWFTVNAYHGCHYCMAVHTGIAKAENVPEQVIDIARKAGDYADPKLQALKDFTLKMVEKRGRLEPSEVDAFIAAGFTKRHVIDVVLAISHKTLSNYTNHIVGTPVDAMRSPRSSGSLCRPPQNKQNWRSPGSPPAAPILATAQASASIALGFRNG